MYTDKFLNKFKEEEMFIHSNLFMECIMGSQAYGVANKDSDFDIVGLYMDNDMSLYPHKYGYINGFDIIPNINQKELKGEKNKIVLENGKDCEAEWHSLTDFFYKVAIKGSPNLTEVLFVRSNLVTYHDSKDAGIAMHLRDNRRTFLSMKHFYSLKGYIHAQLMRIKRGVVTWHKTGKCDNSKRKEYYEKYGYDIKMSYHCLRLIDNIIQMLTINDIDLMRNKNECINMRNGTWGTFDKFEETVLKRIEDLENMINKPNKLSIEPRCSEIKKLLLECIEMWYGSVDNLVRQNEYVSAKDVMECLKRIEEKIKN